MCGSKECRNQKSSVVYLVILTGRAAQAFELAEIDASVRALHTSSPSAYCTILHEPSDVVVVA